MPKRKNINYSEAFGDDRDNPKLFIDTWMNNGYNEQIGETLEFKDLIATPNANYWMPKVVETIIREPVEPMTLIPSLLDNISYNPSARITVPAIGALVAYDLAEGQAYPEQTLQIAPGSITVDVQKTGLAFKITEEMQKYSQFDIMNMHIRAGRRALDRWKEQKGMLSISGMGVTLFDNINPTSSVFGTCTGRGIDGAGNGSCRMEDLLKAYSHIMMQGYVPDTILMHPLTWSMWLADPLLQTIVKNTGNGQWFQPHNMPKSDLPWANAGQSKMGRAGGYGPFTPSGNAGSETPTSVSKIDQNLNSPAVIPGYFPYPLRVLVSPFVPFNVNNNTADIMIFDSNNLGALVIDEGVSVDQWEDMSADTMKVKLKERYAIAIYEEGLAIGVLRNVPVKANEIAFPLQPTISAAGSISALDITTAISGL
jgi:hypothetical protein